MGQLGIGSFLVFLVACGGSEPAAPQTPPPPPASASVAPPPPPADAGVAEAPPPAPAKLDAIPASAKLLEAGAAPRRALRYAFKAGTTERMQLDMKLSMEVAGDGIQAPAIHMPTIRTVLRIDGKELTPEGDLRYTFEEERADVLSDVQVDAKIKERIASTMKDTIGLKGHGRVSPRGVSSEIDFELPPSAPESVAATLESLRDGLKQMTSMLPEEEVGVGGRWEVTSRVPMDGAMVDFKQTYTVTKLSADGMQAKVDTTMSAPANQPFAPPHMPPGADVSLESMTGSGTGNTDAKFKKLVPDAKTKVSNTLSMKIKMKGEEMHSGMKSEIEAVIKPFAGGAPAKKKQ